MNVRRLMASCGLLLLVLASASCKTVVNRLKARDQLNRGVGAFRNAQFQVAIDHFQTAVALDPSLLNAKLYLATAYQQVYIPNGESPENLKLGKQAVQSFEDVLQMDPNNTTALASVARIYYDMKDFEKAKEYQRRRLQIEPNNYEPYYWIGVIDWVDCFARDGKIRNETRTNVPNAKQEFPPLPEKARAELEKQNASVVNEGLEALKKAIELKPNDFDTMAYLNLMHRQKADIESDPKAREADLRTADDWQQKALDLRKSGAAAPAAK